MNHSASNQQPDHVKNWLTVFRCETPEEANDICLELSAAGIAYLLPDQEALEHDIGSEFRVQVSADDYATAKELLFKPNPSSGDPAERNFDPAQVPLSGLLRCLAFFSPLLTLPAILVLYMARDGFSKGGYKRRSDEFAIFFLIGAIFWAILAVIMFSRYPAK